MDAVAGSPVKPAVVANPDSSGKLAAHFSGRSLNPENSGATASTLQASGKTIPTKARPTPVITDLNSREVQGSVHSISLHHR